MENKNRLYRAFSLIIIYVSVFQWLSAGLTDHVNPFLGTATLWDAGDLGFERKPGQPRTWGAEVFPGAALPNAMVQLTPVTMWRSGAGYQYEDTVILGFAHTAMGHWNLLDLPVMPFTGEISPDDYASRFSHDNESARPGYYQVFLDRYGVNAELTSTLRTGFHRYTFRPGAEKRLMVNVAHNQNIIDRWDIKKVAENAFAGSQGNGFYYYAVTSLPVSEITVINSSDKKGAPIAVVDFRNSRGEQPLEVRIGVSAVSIENAKENLEAESAGKSFGEIVALADGIWENLLGKIKVEGSTDRYRNIFYTTLYRAMLMPRLQSDVNGQYRDNRGQVVGGAGFRYYSNPAFWDVHRNQLILLGMLQPDVALDVIKSTVDRGEKGGGYIPTYFHGDHAPTFIIGSYKRGITDFDLARAYALCLKSATVPGRGGRRYLKEYIANGYITDENLPFCPFSEEHKGGVAKTLEYAYDDYAVAQIAHELGDSAAYKLLTDRSKNYRNVFDPSTGFFRGRIRGGAWLEPFDPGYPYFQHMYREANGWNCLFYAPHDPEGIVALYPSPSEAEALMDTMLVTPWCGLDVSNMTGFIGSYCHGNQPGHNIPYTYYFVGRQEKSQALLDEIMDRFYDMGAERLAYSGMDDAGEMSAWFVFNAIGLYTFSPADAEYIVTVPLFDRITLMLDETPATIRKSGKGRKIARIDCGGEPVEGYFIGHNRLKGNTLTVTVSD